MADWVCIWIWLQVGLFKSLEDKEYLDFMTVADELRTDYQFAHTLDSSFVPNKGVVLVAPAGRLYKCFDEGLMMLKWVITLQYTMASNSQVEWDYVLA